MFSWMTRLNPVVSTVSVYLPTGSDGSVKFPVAVVVVSKMAPLSTFLAITLAPGTTAAAGSVTDPVMVPRSLCANAAKVNNMQHIVFDRTRVHLDAGPPVATFSTNKLLISPFQLGNE